MESSWKNPYGAILSIISARFRRHLGVCTMPPRVALDSCAGIRANTHCRDPSVGMHNYVACTTIVCEGHGLKMELVVVPFGLLQSVFVLSKGMPLAAQPFGT